MRHHTGLPLALFCAVVLLLVSTTASAQTEADSLLRVVKGKSIVLEFGENIQTVSLADDEIADVAVITETDLVIIGRKMGVTSLKVWGQSGGLREYEVEVDRDLVPGQVVLDVQIAEVNRTAISEYGVDFLVHDNETGEFQGKQTIGSYAGDVTPIDPLNTLLLADQGVTGVLRTVRDDYDVAIAVRALQQRGLLKMLANPRLISFSGEAASFLVGGEFPVPVSRQFSAEGVPTITIEWKEFGVQLDFLPTIIDTNLVNLRIAPEVSSLDWGNSISLGGFVIPSLRTRRASSVVELNSDQSLVLSGLLSSETIQTTRRVPILGHIPIIGFFFSSKETNSVETELLIVVSPHIVTSVADEPIPPLPGVEPPPEINGDESGPSGDLQYESEAPGR